MFSTPSVFVLPTTRFRLTYCVSQAGQEKVQLSRPVSSLRVLVSGLDNLELFGLLLGAVHAVGASLTKSEKKPFAP